MCSIRSVINAVPLFCVVMAPVRMCKCSSSLVRSLCRRRTVGYVLRVSCVDWLQSLKQFFINVSYHILVASLTLMALLNLKQFFINVSYHILGASLTLMALF